MKTQTKILTFSPPAGYVSLSVQRTLLSIWAPKTGLEVNRYKTWVQSQTQNKRNIWLRKQPIIALYFEFENELKFYNLQAWSLAHILQWSPFITLYLGSPAGKGLTSWLSCVWCFIIFVTFPWCVLGRVWCLIVLIPDLCLIFHTSIGMGCVISGTGDNCIQNFHLWRYIVGYTIGNVVLW